MKPLEENIEEILPDISIGTNSLDKDSSRGNTSESRHTGLYPNSKVL